MCASGSHPESRRRPRWSASSRGAACDPGWSVAETCPHPPSPPPSCQTLPGEEKQETRHQGFLSKSHQQLENQTVKPFKEREALSREVHEAINKWTFIRKTTWHQFTGREGEKKNHKRFKGGVQTKPALFPSCCSPCLVFPGTLTNIKGRGNEPLIFKRGILILFYPSGLNQQVAPSPGGRGPGDSIRFHGCYSERIHLNIPLRAKKWFWCEI